MAKASSSTKRAAKLAQGSNRAVRFQGGTVFPLAVAITLIVGMALIVYGRQTQPAADATPPLVNDHWHQAYGFYLCDRWYVLQGDLEERDSNGNLANADYLRTYIHSHNDGVIHWHPYTTVAIGKRAKLGIFLDNYGVEMTDTSLSFPDNFSMLDFTNYDADNVPTIGVPVESEWSEADTKCGDEDAELSVVKWKYPTDLSSDGQRYITAFGDIPITNDGSSFAFVFAPRDADPGKPPHYGFLDELGAIDSGYVPEGPGTGDGSLETLPEAAPEDTLG